ncbi:TonB family protein [Phenylobacterium sp. LH3H17]|uniref:TonB family protein n=1 Tax=Phenylobacterium sp. LH3H17 TaxID=2903901 RepID=UPI0020C943A8|nr:TonB family protein [Phenylobacterium sp. LH3H17]UTP38731.1 TonB family protein [Phenylobacterium sp. LH3H17]
MADEGFDEEPNWIRRPSPEDLMGVWPRDAMRQGLGGKAKIACVVTLQGALRDCVVVSESPAGAGFGAAAIAITPQLMMTPAIKGGQPVLAKVTIPINFEKPLVPTGSHLPGGGVALARTMLSGVTWTGAPTYAQVAAAYPEKARKGQAAGKSILVCRFKSEGRVGSCEVIAEEPKSQGFGSAAKTLAPRFQGPSQLADGQPTLGMEVQIPFVFAAEMLDPQKRVIGRPKWTRLPKGEDVVSGYPPAAAKAGVKGGRVIIECEVAAEGRLAACATESEDPVGLGFAAAALELSKTFQVQLWTADGLPTVGGQIRVPIRYQLPNAPPAKP